MSGDDGREIRESNDDPKEVEQVLDSLKDTVQKDLRESDTKVDDEPPEQRSDG